VNRDVAPVIAAQALLAHSLNDDVNVAYLQRTWNLDDIDAQAALAAARYSSVEGTAQKLQHRTKNSLLRSGAFAFEVQRAARRGRFGAVRF